MEREHDQPKISALTRRKLIASFGQRTWSGDLDDADFLARIYDLTSLPSTDQRFPDASRDIWQHRVANPSDWDDLWVFSDDRFGLHEDKSLLRFLAESIHPEVRGDADEVADLVGAFNSHLSRDGWELVPSGDVSGYPIYDARQRSRQSISAPTHFPFAADALVASIAEFLKGKGYARELAVLINSRPSITEESFDNWNGGTRGWGMNCALPASLYARISSEDRRECEALLLEASTEFFRPFTNDRMQSVIVSPAADLHDDWRSAANEWLSGRGINNQGRVRSNNIASLEVDGLLFRSEPEINLYRAFKQHGVTFAPLAVFIRGGQSYARLEPDFVVLKDGILLVVEVDGDTYHRETPSDAHVRLLPLDHEGAKIERVKAEDCKTPELAKKCAGRLLEVIERLFKRR